MALVALLFVAGLQLQEAGHNHALDGTVAECLSCKGSSDAALPIAASLPLSTPTARRLPADADGLLSRGICSPFHARGPPLHS